MFYGDEQLRNTEQLNLGGSGTHTIIFSIWILWNIFFIPFLIISFANMFYDLAMSAQNLQQTSPPAAPETIPLAAPASAFRSHEISSHETKRPSFTGPDLSMITNVFQKIKVRYGV